MKRFTDTEKWSDSWFRKLPCKIKLFWIYLCDRCSNCGVWKPDFELASFCIGQEVTEEEVTQFLEGRISKLQPGWFIVKFIDFQYGKLNPSCRPHAAVLASLDTLSIPYTKGIYTPKTRLDQNGSTTLSPKDTVAEFEEYRKRIYMIVGRELADHMGYTEQTVLAELIRNRPHFAEEISLISEFKARAHFFPESVSTLLEKWQATLDRAKQAPQLKKRIAPTL